jgi:uncharacterized protein (DUF2236 family)
MRHFVKPDSIVRAIWGSSDTILFIFAGAAAEFALNKAVDWLFFTGRLPADPIGRLFSTVVYAQRIVFSTEEEARTVIRTMAGIHHQVEQNRNQKIPAWAYRDVLFMLIDYSIRSFELLHHNLSVEDKEEVFSVFKRVGEGMGLVNLPADYTQWIPAREAHMFQDLEKSRYTTKLYEQYKKHLGFVRFRILKGAQASIVPQPVKASLKLRGATVFRALLQLYAYTKRFNVEWFFKELILPERYLKQIRSLDRAQSKAKVYR